MANLTQTRADVGIGSLATAARPVTVFEAVQQGQPGYRNTDNEYGVCESNGSTDKAEQARAECIFVTPAGAGGTALAVFANVSGGSKPLIDLGATLTVGLSYYVSRTKGAICPEADLITGDSVTLLGFASTTGLLEFAPIATGKEKP